MKKNLLSFSVASALAAVIASPLALGDAMWSNGRTARGETVSNSRIDAMGQTNGEGCTAILMTNRSDNMANNGLVLENTPVNIEMTVIDTSSKAVLGSENIITFWEDDGRGGMRAEGDTLFINESGHACVISNVSVPGYSRAGLNVTSRFRHEISFPNGKIEFGPLANPHTVAPVLSTIFNIRMQEDLSDDYIAGIPNSIGNEDFRLVNSGNVENYAKLMRDVLMGNTGLQGSTDAGYSIDFLELKNSNAINNFLLNSLVIPAINLGMVSSSLNNQSFADFLRRTILADMNQDSSYEYGSENQLKASVALQYSSNVSSNAQTDQGSFVGVVVNRDYLLEEFERVSEGYDESLKPAYSAEYLADVNKMAYHLPYNFKTWDSSGQGVLHDVYIQENPINGKTEIFRLRAQSYGPMPTHGSSDDTWTFIGPKALGTPGRSGEVYYHLNTNTGQIDFFLRTADYAGSQIPDPNYNNENGWEYLNLGMGAENSMDNITPQDAYEFALFANKYRGLEGSALSEAVLGTSGDVSIDTNNNIIYSTATPGGLLGKNVAEIAAIAYGVELEDLSAAQVTYTQLALENLSIDTLYPYGSLHNVKASILNRIAYETMDKELLDQIGTGVEPYVLDELIKDNADFTSLDFVGLVRDYLGLSFRLNGVIDDEHELINVAHGVELFANTGQSGESVVIAGSVRDLGTRGFDDKMKSFTIPAGWKVRFYEGANYTGGYYTHSAGSGNLNVPNGISSVQVLEQAPPPESEGIDIYQYVNQGGMRVRISNSIPNLTAVNMNDRVWSFNIPSGWQVRFYEGMNYTGGFYTRDPGKGNFSLSNGISSIEILKKPSHIPEVVRIETMSDLLYRLLSDLESAQDAIYDTFELVAYDNFEPVEAIPLTDELFARAQLFKYGLKSELVEDLWRKYLVNGHLRSVSDSRITAAHLAKERELANAPAQDMWARHFDALVPVASNYLSTLMDIKLKLSGLEPLVDRAPGQTTLRIAHGLAVDEYVESDYFNGIWNSWVVEPDSWIIYGPDIDYSINTASDIFDFMSFSDVSFGEKLPYYSNQHESPKNRDFALHAALDEEEANKYCTKYDWNDNWGIPLSRPGALGLEATRYECGVRYVTRSSNLSTMQASYEHLVSEMMKSNKWDLKTVQTNRDTLHMILQMFIPVWGTVEAFQKGDNVGGVSGLLADYMFFAGFAAGVKSGIKPLLSLAKNPAMLANKGVSLVLQSGDNVVGAVTQVNKQVARVTAKQVVKVVAKAAFDELNPLAGLDDLAIAGVKKASKKFDDIRGGNKLASLSPKVGYNSRTFHLPKIDQSSVDVSTGVGMPSRDRVAMGEVADRENVVIGVRPVDEKSASLIESGLYGSKSLLVKSKSSDWGPHSGFIPVDQKYAKKSARVAVDKFNHHSQNSLNTGVAVDVPLGITDARLKELQGFDAIGEMRFDSETGMYVAHSSAEGIEQAFYYESTTLGGQKGWNVYVKEDGQMKPLKVMGSPDSNKAMTADYDLFTVMYHNSDFGLENVLHKPKTWDEWKESVNYDDLSPEYKEMYDNQQIYDTKGAGTLGTISERVKDLKTKINNQLGRGKGMELVHHGADDANPYAVLEDNFPATFFVPRRLLEHDGLGEGLGSLVDYFPVTKEGTVILHSSDDFANFHQVIVNRHFTGPLNELWEAKAGEKYSRQARLSHVFLDARDQVAAALGAKVGEYRPYYVKPSTQE